MPGARGSNGPPPHSVRSSCSGGFIADCLKKGFVSQEAADVLGRASSRDVDQSWIEITGRRIAICGDLNHMGPVISKVVDVVDEGPNL